MATDAPHSAAVVMPEAQSKPAARSTTTVGSAGEQAATRFLTSQGLRLLDRNFGGAGGELDLVMMDGNTVVFVEVRYRRSARFGGAAASVSASKQRRIAAAAESWRMRHRKWRDYPCRFDVVALTGSAPGAVDVDVRWIRRAFDTS